MLGRGRRAQYRGKPIAILLRVVAVTRRISSKLLPNHYCSKYLNSVQPQPNRKIKFPHILLPKHAQETALAFVYTTPHHLPLFPPPLSPMPILRPPRPSQRLLNTSTQLRNPKRLRNHIIHTRLQRNLHLFRPHIRRNRNDRNMTAENAFTLEFADVADAG
jgi:hypothetical protein